MTFCQNFQCRIIKFEKEERKNGKKYLSFDKLYKNDKRFESHTLLDQDDINQYKVSPIQLSNTKLKLNCTRHYRIGYIHKVLFVAYKKKIDQNKSKN